MGQDSEAVQIDNRVVGVVVDRRLLIFLISIVSDIILICKNRKTVRIPRLMASGVRTFISK